MAADAGRLLGLVGSAFRAAEIPVVLLRGDDGFLDPARDVDLLIHPAHFLRAERVARETAEAAGWRVLFRERVANHRHLLLWRAGGGDGVPPACVHLDLQDRLGLKGFRYAAAEPFLEGRVEGPIFPRPRREARVVALVLHLALDHAVPRDPTRETPAIEDGAALTAFCRSALPGRVAACLEVWIRDGGRTADLPGLAARLRRALGASDPLNLVRPAFVRLRRRARILGRRRGALVVFVGPDGAGKSTVVEAVASMLPRGPFPLRTVYMGKREPFLPTSRWIRALHERKAGRSRAARPGGAPRAPSRLADLAGLANWVLEQWARHWFQVRPCLQQGGIVLADRYGFDVAQREPSSLAHRRPLQQLLPRLFPAPDLTCLLWEDPEVLHRRKAERSVAESAALLERLRHTVATVTPVREVRTDRPTAVTAASVVTEICRLLEARCDR